MLGGGAESRRLVPVCLLRVSRVAVWPFTANRTKNSNKLPLAPPPCTDLLGGQGSVLVRSGGTWLYVWGEFSEAECGGASRNEVDMRGGPHSSRTAHLLPSCDCLVLGSSVNSSYMSAGCSCDQSSYSRG